MAVSFFQPDGDGFVATELTRGPWDPGFQHAGPPAALLGRAVERADGGDAKRVGRITFEILRPIPVARLTVGAEVVRPGGNVDLVEARMADADGPVMLARAWRIRERAVDVPDDVADAPPGSFPRGPDDGVVEAFFDVAHLEQDGYHTAMEARFLSGAFREPGPAVVWMRMRYPLLPDEDPTPLARALVAADSGNGVSARLDPRRVLFINTDLTVHTHRMPEGEWVCLDARTTLNGTSIGLAQSALYDTRGAFGRSLQTLYVAQRG